MEWVVKLTKHGGQYRITLPRDLLVLAGLENADFVKLGHKLGGMVIIREYYGKTKEKGDLQKDQT